MNEPSALAKRVADRLCKDGAISNGMDICCGWTAQEVAEEIDAELRDAAEKAWVSLLEFAMEDSGIEFSWDSRIVVARILEAWAK